MSTNLAKKLCELKLFKKVTIKSFGDKFVYKIYIYISILLNNKESKFLVLLNFRPTYLSSLIIKKQNFCRNFFSASPFSISCVPVRGTSIFSRIFFFQSDAVAGSLPVRVQPASRKSQRETPPFLFGLFFLHSLNLILSFFQSQIFPQSGLPSRLFPFFFTILSIFHCRFFTLLFFPVL